MPVWITFGHLGLYTIHSHLNFTPPPAVLAWSVSIVENSLSPFKTVQHPCLQWKPLPTKSLKGFIPLL